MSGPKIKDLKTHVEIIIEDVTKSASGLQEVKLDFMKGTLSYMYFYRNVVNKFIGERVNDYASNKAFPVLSIPKGLVYLIETDFSFDGLQIFDNENYCFDTSHNSSRMKVKLNTDTKIKALKFTIEIDNENSEERYFTSSIDSELQFAAPIGSDLSQWVLAKSITCSKAKIVRPMDTGGAYLFEFMHAKTNKEIISLQYDLNLRATFRTSKGIDAHQIYTGYKDQINPMVYIRCRTDKEGDYKFTPIFDVKPSKEIALKNFTNPKKMFPSKGWRVFYFNKDDLKARNGSVGLQFKENAACDPKTHSHIEMVVYDGVRPFNAYEKLPGKPIVNLFEK